jgi:hypothetical protein
MLAYSYPTPGHLVATLAAIDAPRSLSFVYMINEPEYKGPIGAIMVAGSLANESEGYSANMPFGPRDVSDSPAKSINLGSAGIMVGKPYPTMMQGFPVETRFIPYLALRNTTAKPLDLHLDSTTRAAWVLRQ